MSPTATLPAWMLYLTSIGTPAAAFLAVLIGNWVSRRGQKEEQHRRRRSDVLTVLQWAADLAISEDSAKAAVGVAQLRELSRFALDAETQRLVDAAFECIVAPMATAMDAGYDVQPVVSTASSRIARTHNDIAAPALPSTHGFKDGGDGASE